MLWRTLVAGTLALLLAACGGEGDVTELRQAELLSSTGRSIVALPHVPGRDEQQPDAIEWVYLLSLPALDANAGVMAVSIPGRHADVRLVFNGQPLAATRISPYQSTGVYAELPQLLPESPGQLELHLSSRVGLQSRLDPVWFGASDKLRRLALSQSLQLSLSTTIAFGILFIGALVSMVFAIASSRASLFVFSFILLSIAVRQAALLVFDAWSDDGAEFALLVGSRMLTLMGMAVALPMIARQRYADLLLVAGVVSALGIALLVSGWGSIALRRGAILAFVGLVVLLALWRSWRALHQSRQWFWLGATGLILVNYLLTLADWVISPDKLSAQLLDRMSLFSALLLLGMVYYGVMQIRLAYRGTMARNVDLDEKLRRYKAELAESMAREQASAILDASRRERKHWIQEIHDGVGSLIVAARILSENPPDADNSRILVGVLEEALEQLRMLMGALTPDVRTLATLLGEMRYRLAPRLEAMGYTLIWSAMEMPDAEGLSREAAMNVQRIVQESITNALKHAGATGLKIDIFERAGCCVVRIDDNGTGFDMDKVSLGRGVVSVRARAAACGASIHWSMLSPGTRVELTMPNHMIP